MRLLAFFLAACSSDPKPPEVSPPPLDTGGHTGTPPDDSVGADSGVEQIDPCAETSWPDLVLSELLASNLAGATDADGDSSDWLELQNRGAEAVDLAGWTLRDADGSWTFGARTLEAGAVLQVWASGKDLDGEEVHTSFSLSATDPELWLDAPDGCTVDHAHADRLYGDISYGRDPADTNTWCYFLEPTPGAANTTECRPGFAAPPVLSPASGFYADGVEVTVSTDEAGATLTTTTDGSDPDESDAAYTAPLAVDGGPVVVRARAFKDGLWPSRITTGTYSEDTSPVEAGMYTISLVSDPVNLWDDETGIYAFGDSYEPTYPYFGANFWEDWEKPVHVQIWDASGLLVTDQDAGISIHGGYTRAFDQKSLRLYARTAYGPDAFEGQFFPHEDADSWHVLVLQIGMDWCGTHLIEPIVSDLFRDPNDARLAGADMAAWAPAQVWINGEYWGYYNLRERLDDTYVEHHHPELDSDNLDRVELGWTHNPHWELEQGSWDNFDALNAFVLDADLSDPDQWATFDGMVDLDSLATAMLAQAYIGNSDWWWNNLRLWRSRDADGQWRWMIYDLGHGFVSSDYDQFGTSVTWSGEGLPIADALENEAFRVLLANTMADLMNTSLRPDAALGTWDAMVEQVSPAMEDQMGRWCSSSYAGWESSTATARAFVGRRTEVLRDQVQDHLGLSDTANLTLVAEPAGAGTFQLTAITVEAPFAGAYFQDIPIPVTAIPADGYTFAGWSDTTLGDEASASLTLSRDTVLVARFEAVD